MDHLIATWKTLSGWWSTAEGKIAVLLAAAALGRLLFVGNQVREGKRKWQVRLLIYESGVAVAALILTQATASWLRLLLGWELDLSAAAGLALFYGWLGMHGMQLYIVRALQKRGVLPEEKPGV